jgi:hypothetical protein
MNDQANPFGEIIYAYTRAQAVADGFQVEVTKTAQEAGIKFPVFIARTAFDAYVTVPPNVGASQSDLAFLEAENVDWDSYRYAWAERAKTVAYPERFRRSKKLHVVWRRIAQRLEQTCRHQGRHIMRLAINDPGRLFRRQPGRELPQQP